MAGEINMFQTIEDIREQYGIPEDWDEADFEESGERIIFVWLLDTVFKD